MDVNEVGDPDLDAGQGNADGTGNESLNGVSRADAGCLSHPHNSGSGVLGCVCHASSTPDMPITRRVPATQPTGDPPGCLAGIGTASLAQPRYAEPCPS